MEQICKDCDETFTITESDKWFFESKGLSLPKRCYFCRQKRRDNNRIDLSKVVGKYICRTRASIHGDRSYVGEDSKIKLLGIKDDGTLIIEGKWYWMKGTEHTLPPDFNDGYWKVVEETIKSKGEQLC